MGLAQQLEITAQQRLAQTVLERTLRRRRSFWAGEFCWKFLTCLMFIDVLSLSLIICIYKYNYVCVFDFL